MLDRMLLISLAAVGVASVAQPSGSDLRFDSFVVKHYDHASDLPTQIGNLPRFGCFVGPSKLQYTCSGSVTRLLAEALGLSDSQYDEKRGDKAEYVIAAKLLAPATREQMDAAMRHILLENLGIQYHFEKRSLKALFLTISDLKKLPIAKEALPEADAWPGPPARLGDPMPAYTQFVKSLPTTNPDELRTQCTNITFSSLVQVMRRFGMLVVNATNSELRVTVTFTTTYDWQNRTPGVTPSITNLPEVQKTFSNYGLNLDYREGPVDFLIVDRLAAESTFMN